MATIDEIFSAATARLSSASNSASTFTNILSNTAAKLNNAYYDPMAFPQHANYVNSFRRGVHAAAQAPEAETRSEKTYDNLFSGDHYWKWLGNLQNIVGNVPSGLSYVGYAVPTQPAVPSAAVAPTIESLEWSASELPPAPSGFATVAAPSIDAYVPRDIIESIALGQSPIPDPPELPNDLPTLDSLGARPITEYVIPGDLFEWAGESGIRDTLLNVCASVPDAYKSAFLVGGSNVVVDALTADILHGGTGMLDQDEAATWERARDRAMSALIDTSAEIQRDYARRGFALPPLAITALQQAAQDKAQAAMAEVEREIIGRTTTMLAEQRRFALAQAVQWEGMTIDQHDKAQNRVLQAVQLVGDMGVKLHNLTVERARLRMDAYKSLSDVMTGWVQSAIAETELYRLKIAKADAEHAKDANTLQLMESMNRAVEIADRIRQTVNQTFELRMAGERLKLESNKELIERYQAQLTAVNAKWGAYGQYVQASVSAVAEPAKIKLEQFRAETDNFASVSRARSEAASAQVAQYEANIRRHQVLTQILGAAMDHTIQKAQALAQHKSVDLDHWKTKLAAVRQNVESRLEHTKADNEAFWKGYQVGTDELKKIHETFQNSAWRAADVSNAGLGVYRDQIAAAEQAMSGIITLATSEVT